MIVWYSFLSIFAHNFWAHVPIWITFFTSIGPLCQMNPYIFCYNFCKWKITILVIMTKILHQNFVHLLQLNHCSDPNNSFLVPLNFCFNLLIRFVSVNYKFYFPTIKIFDIFFEFVRSLMLNEYPIKFIIYFFDKVKVKNSCVVIRKSILLTKLR